MNHFIKRWSFAWIGIALAIFMNAAMAWITYTGLQLNRERQASEAEFAYNNQMRLALWRLDSALAPIVATEAAKPIDVVTALAQATLPKPTTNYVVGYFEGYIDQASAIPSKQSAKATQLSLRSLVIEHSTLPVKILNELQANDSLPTDLVALEQNRSSVIGNPTLERSDLAQINQFPESHSNQNALQSFNSTLADQKMTASQQAVVAEELKQLDMNVSQGQQAAIAQDRVQRGNLYLGNLRVQNEAQQQIASNYQSFQAPQEVLEASIPLFQPTWVGDQLFLIRRTSDDVPNREELRFQGVLMDWPAIQSDSIFAVSDLFKRTGH